MKILFPTGSFYPAQTGGPDNTVYWINKALQRRSFQTYVVTTHRGQPPSTPLGEWISTEYGRAIYTENAVHYLPLTLLYRAMRVLPEMDVLHLSMITYPASFLMAILNSWFVGKPMLWSSRGDLDPPMLRRSRRKKSFVIWLINTFVRKDLLWFHSTCDAETTYIRQNFGADSRVIQIPNYMELPERIPASKDQYLLYIGRIDPKKAIENLITALDRSLAFREGPFVLRIVGDHDNAYGRSLQKQVVSAGLADKVVFMGHRKGREKEEILAKAWFTLMPSHSENFGIVVMEGLAQATPAVASTGTPWSILPERDAGYWVDNDPESLQRVVEEILAIPPDQLQRMSENALRLAEDEFSIDANVGEWINAYQEVTS